MARHQMRKISTQKKSEGANIQFQQVEKEQGTCYFGLQPKLGALGSAEYNPIDFSDEGGE